MKKFMLSFGILIMLATFVFCNQIFFIANAENISNRFVVTSNFAILYESPDFSSIQIKSLPHKTVVEVEMESEMPKQYNYDGFVFYKTVNMNDANGYIYSDLLAKEGNSIVATPKYNAKTNQNCKLFILQNNEIVETEQEISIGQRLFLYKGFDSKQKFNAVCFVVGENIVYGFVETKYIAPDGINPLIISIIIIILSILGIIFALLFMKNKKHKIK